MVRKRFENLSKEKDVKSLKTYKQHVAEQEKGLEFPGYL